VEIGGAWQWRKFDGVVQEGIFVFFC